MKTVRGDLIQLAADGKFDVIVHGCNCHCTMGAGIAMAVRTHFPQAYELDQKTKPADRSKLGTIGQVTVERMGRNITVVNAYTQFDYGGEGLLADYDAIRKAMACVKKEFHGKRIAYPKIGAGLARGDWNIISRIIDEELAGEDHTLVVLAT